jgi:DNA-binding IscR family transcriptional regulator
MELAERMQIPAEETRAITERLENLGALKASGENGFEVLPAIDLKHLMVFDLVEGLEERKSIDGATAPNGYGDIIQEILSLVREQGREGVEGLSVADLLARAKEEFADSEDETDALSAETDEITDVVDAGEVSA